MTWEVDGFSDTVVEQLTVTVGDDEPLVSSTKSDYCPI